MPDLNPLSAGSEPPKVEHYEYVEEARPRTIHRSARINLNTWRPGPWTVTTVLEALHSLAAACPPEATVQITIPELYAHWQEPSNRD